MAVRPMRPFNFPALASSGQVTGTQSLDVALYFFTCNFSDSESPRQWHLSQASDFQSEEKGWRLIWMQGDRRQLWRASGTQSPGLPKSQRQQPCSEDAGLRGLAHVAAGCEASQERLGGRSRKHAQLCQPASALHFQPSSGSQNPQTKSTIRYGNPFYPSQTLRRKMVSVDRFMYDGFKIGDLVHLKWGWAMRAREAGLPRGCALPISHWQCFMSRGSESWTSFPSVFTHYKHNKSCNVWLHYKCMFIFSADLCIDNSPN